MPNLNLRGTITAERQVKALAPPVAIDVDWLEIGPGNARGAMSIEGIRFLVDVSLLVGDVGLVQIAPDLSQNDNLPDLDYPEGSRYMSWKLPDTLKNLIGEQIMFNGVKGGKIRAGFTPGSQWGDDGSGDNYRSCEIVQIDLTGEELDAIMVSVGQYTIGEREYMARLADADDFDTHLAVREWVKTGGKGRGRNAIHLG